MMQDSLHLYRYRAKVVSVYDGDTITVDIDLGLNVWVRNEKIRLARIDAPEVRGDERPLGLEAADYLRRLLPEGTEIFIQTIKNKKGKYGRYLGEVILIAPFPSQSPQYGQTNINDLMVKSGHAVYAEY